MLNEELRKLLSKKSEGFGDTVEKIATVTGAKKLTDAYANRTGKDCGCNKRKDFLNKLINYGNPNAKD